MYLIKEPVETVLNKVRKDTLLFASFKKPVQMLDTRGKTSIVKVQAGSKVIDVLDVDTETTCNDVIKTVLQTNRVVAHPNNSQYQLMYKCKTKESALNGNAKVLESFQSHGGFLILRPFEQFKDQIAIKTRAKKTLHRLVTLFRKNMKHNLSIETKKVSTTGNTTIHNNLNISSNANNRNNYVSKNISHILTTSDNIQCKQNRYVKLILKHDVLEKIQKQYTSNDNSTILNRGFVDYVEISDVEEAISDVESTGSGYDSADNDITAIPNLRDVFNDCIIEYDDGDYTEIRDCDSVFGDGSSICDLERNIIGDYSTSAKQEHIKLAFNGAGPYLHFTLNGEFDNCID